MLRPINRKNNCTSPFLQNSFHSLTISRTVAAQLAETVNCFKLSHRIKLNCPRRINTLSLGGASFLTCFSHYMFHRTNARSHDAMVRVLAHIRAAVLKKLQTFRPLSVYNRPGGSGQLSCTNFRQFRFASSPTSEHSRDGWFL